MAQGKKFERPLAQNKKASHDYSIIDTVEAGMVLTGTEIKSVRARRINLKDGFAQIRNGEAWLLNVHISPYDQGNQFNHDPLRNRKLLLHRKELRHLTAQLSDKGLTLVPLKVYLKHGYAKVLLGVAKGKHAYDKRETIKKRDQDRQIQRALKNYG
ncbi:MAG: SsrA-binding protein SmpB [Liquorilactobacillus nagelii]|jgi:SsrA-binding protein|uniref:SsrA-binding protein n=1 Tax=Liquorilactobacillus nagelii TaxID=82688 RepID=A0A3S6QU19_9LACO|nr:SsrA-binding protein SmpB [Liquorilactobacillus nagelii]AUJ31553.1 SsrA-binding protein [Liquorilactobacillus nagelii]MCC7616086.1 SsrA-binding protein [Liquorilactobacillus nagelii]MCI1633247.1 SsrA-binding protein SmpB [Liquorilactobacillus nagelii]MCI1921132.1 SsrA-binding protein SmpB [Liquorilactobacillus nagelii]MCI1975676.1 SsrA-binding protein SmpB [Liquorilactobacillus nagelii]